MQAVLMNIAAEIRFHHEPFYIMIYQQRITIRRLTQLLLNITEDAEPRSDSTKYMQHVHI